MIQLIFGKNDGEDNTKYWHTRHDIFNLLVLPIIIALDIRVIVDNNDSQLFLYILAFITYIIVDTIWIMFQPRCVASPVVICIHHFVTVIGLSVQANVEFSAAKLACFGALV